jgi:hypothetical protein
MSLRVVRTVVWALLLSQLLQFGVVCAAITAAPSATPTEFTNSEPVLTTAAKTFNGTFLRVSAFHTRDVTNITWSVPAARASAQDYIVVYEDKLASHTWFQTWNPWLVDLDPPADAVDLSAVADVNWCDRTAVAPFVHDVMSAFHSPAVLAQALPLNETLFYAGSKAREPNVVVAAAGSASVALTEPGLYKVCLFLQSPADPCLPVECVTVELYQPPYDYLEVEANSLVEPVTIRFNMASTAATPGDWYYSVGNLSTTATAANTVSFNITITKHA